MDSLRDRLVGRLVDRMIALPSPPQPHAPQAPYHTMCGLIGSDALVIASRGSPHLGRGVNIVNSDTLVTSRVGNPTWVGARVL